MKPNYNVLQATVDMEGTRQLRRVGAMWGNTSKNGKQYYNLKIGELSLLVFENNDKTGEGLEIAQDAAARSESGVEKEIDAEMEV